MAARPTRHAHHAVVAAGVRAALAARGPACDRRPVPCRLALTVLLAIPLAACEPAPELRAFDVTAPEAPVELLPIAGESLQITWTFDADDADEVVVAVTAVPTTATGAEQWLGAAGLERRELRYVQPPGALFVPPLPPQIAPGVYQLVANALDDNNDVLAASTAPGLLVMQGVTFRATELTFTADVDRRDLWMTTVTASTARATVVLIGAGGGPRWVISEGVIASDLAPVGRVVTFTGRTVDDVAIPAGDYTAMAELSARGGTVTYPQPGPLIHWRP